VSAGPPAAVDRPDRTLLFGLIRLVNVAARPFQEGIGRRHRLGLSAWRALAVLAADATTTAAEIAARTGLDKMTVSRALASLEATGRIARRPDPHDGRRALVSLTPAGRKVFEAVWAQAREREAAALAGITAAERTRLARAVRAITDALLAADALSDSRTGPPAPPARRRPARAGRPSAPGPRPSRAPARRTGSPG
jgi:DNA-binding MarR family transcriptional regulator